MTLGTEHTASEIVERYFTDGKDPLEGVDWVERTARAGDFEQEGVIAPDFWSDMAVGITAKLYFATVNGVRENSVRAMIERVAKKITNEGCRHGYFTCDAATADEHGNLEFMWNDDAKVFYHELCYLLVYQMAAFNTPVWLNVGVPGRKQCCSACFLLGIEDTMLGERFGGRGDHSIMDWVATESAIFKMGAGSGVNISTLRGSMEPLSTGGEASGPTSYMRLGDANAGTLKSGGAHRRAAKMVIENVDHPDIRDFIDCKRREDERMKILAEAGIEIDPFTASGEKTIAEVTSFQNENISVGASNAFMMAATDAKGGTPRAWDLIARITGEVIETVDASSLLDDIVDATWRCGDPGMVFLDTVNEWHTTPMLRGEPSPITTCNPCAETWLNDDSSCNLASLNLLKFVSNISNGTPIPLSFNVPAFRAAIDIMVLAMDITCSFSELPTEHIRDNTRDLRQLGLGYSNLGATLMSQGMPYDSLEARDWAASVTALMTGRAYRRSAELAKEMGAYACFEENREAHIGVIRRHMAALHQGVQNNIWAHANGDWQAAIIEGNAHGFRNSQATVLAPTGTISYLMGCDTTGLEPGFSLVQHKGLAGGGSVTITNQSVERALQDLGYFSEDVKDILDHLERTDHLPEMPEDTDHALRFAYVTAQHMPVFATANEISASGHLGMVAAVQPFLSGAPSKTINLSSSATREDVRGVFVDAWSLGCKAVSVYRDGSKATQVLTSTAKAERPEREPLLKTLIENPAVELRSEPKPAVMFAPTPAEQEQGPARQRLPSERQSITHKFSIGGHEGYITAGMYEDGRLGEFFATGVGKEGSFLAGMMGSWSIACSIAFQLHPDAFPTLARKYIGMEFDPKGETKNLDIAYAKSFPDYVFRWLVLRFGDTDLQEELGVLSPAVKERLTARLDGHLDVQVVQTNGHVDLSGSRPCIAQCGGLMHRSGTCYTCSSCAANTGCG